MLLTGYESHEWIRAQEPSERLRFRILKNNLDRISTAKREKSSFEQIRLIGLIRSIQKKLLKVHRIHKKAHFSFPYPHSFVKANCSNPCVLHRMYFVLHHPQPLLDFPLQVWNTFLFAKILKSMRTIPSHSLLKNFPRIPPS